jgi:hypothetical protein
MVVALRGGPGTSLEQEGPEERKEKTKKCEKYRMKVFLVAEETMDESD